MMIRTLLLLSAVALLANCGSSVSAVCAKEAECAECTYTKDACAALREGNEDKCLADKGATLDAIKSKGNDKCDKCVDARETLYDCQSAVSSCAAFKDSKDDDGQCAAEEANQKSACGDFRADCYE